MNQFNNLSVAQMAELLKSVITSGNGDLNISLNNGKLSYSMKGDLDLLLVINACAKAGGDLESEDSSTSEALQKLDKENDVIKLKNQLEDSQEENSALKTYNAQLLSVINSADKEVSALKGEISSLRCQIEVLKAELAEANSAKGKLKDIKGMISSL